MSLNIQLLIDGLVLDFQLVEFLAGAFKFGEVDVRFQCELFALTVKPCHGLADRSSCRVEIQLQTGNVQAQ